MSEPYPSQFFVSHLNPEISHPPSPLDGIPTSLQAMPREFTTSPLLTPSLDSLTQTVHSCFPTPLSTFSGSFHDQSHARSCSQSLSPALSNGQWAAIASASSAILRQSGNAFREAEQLVDHLKGEVSGLKYV